MDAIQEQVWTKRVLSNSGLRVSGFSTDWVCVLNEKRPGGERDGELEMECREYKTRFKRASFGIRQHWLRSDPGYTANDCVVWGKRLNLSAPQFAVLQKDACHLPYRAAAQIKWGNICKGASRCKPNVHFLSFQITLLEFLNAFTLKSTFAKGVFNHIL